MKRVDARKPRWLRIITLLVVGVVALTGCGTVASRSGSQPPSSNEPRTVINPPKQLSDFEMPSNTGEPVALSDFRGKPVLLFFGYTQCPDFCPATLGDFKQVKQQLGDQGDDVAYVFVSVDGERDTPEVIDRYVRNFDPSFVGLQGTSETLQPIAKEFGLYAEKNTETETAAGYLINHTVATYLIDQQGQLRTVYPSEATAETFTPDVKALLNEQS